MKKQLILSASFVCLLALSLLPGCKKENDTPAPGGSSGTLPTPTITSFSPTSGSAGGRVVITGTSFSATPASNKVKFGTVEATVDSASATRLVTRIPKDITTGKITVEVGGKSATSAADFTVQQVPVAISGTGGVGGTANVSSEVTVSGAKVASTIEKEGSKSIVQHGHVWSSTKAEPTVNGRIAANTEGKTELGAVPPNATFPYKFQSELKELDPGTTYNVRSYVTTSEGTTYGPTTPVQSRKPCLLSTYNQFGQVSYDAQYRMTGFRSDVPNTKPSIQSLTYNAEGYLVKLESSVNGTASLEQYEYDKGRLTKITHPYGTISYAYDAQGKIAKETTVSGDVTTEYAYADGIMQSVIASKGTTYTVKDGRITKADNGGGNYTSYEYDARGNQTKLENYKADQKSIQFDYLYDDKPNFVQTFFDFKGWSPEQIRRGGFFYALSLGNNSLNNFTQRKYKSSTSDETKTRLYTYTNNRVSGYKETTVDTILKTTYTTTQSYAYSGDCN